MTLLPTEHRRIGKASEMPTVELEDWCGNPRCGRPTYEAPHHIVKRSFGFGPVDWILIDDVPRQNIVRVCWPCHMRLTDHRARIYWDGDEATQEGEWRWHKRVDGVWHDVGPLSVGTFRPGSLPSDGPGANTERDAASSSLSQFGAGHGVQREAGTIRVGVVETPGPEVLEGATCPTCNRRRPHERKPSSPKQTKQLNLGAAPADYVDEFKTRLDTLAEQVGISELPHHRLKVIDVGLELAEHVSTEAWRSIIDDRPWAA